MLQWMFLSKTYVLAEFSQWDTFLSLFKKLKSVKSTLHIEPLFFIHSISSIQVVPILISLCLFWGILISITLITFLLFTDIICSINTTESYSKTLNGQKRKTNKKMVILFKWYMINTTTGLAGGLFYNRKVRHPANSWMKKSPHKRAQKQNDD